MAVLNFGDWHLPNLALQVVRRIFVSIAIVSVIQAFLLALALGIYMLEEDIVVVLVSLVPVVVAATLVALLGKVWLIAIATPVAMVVG